MTSKERLIAAMKFQPVDRTPFMILLGETWLIERDGLSFKDLRDMADLGVDLICGAYDDLGCDSVTSGLGCWIGCLEAIGCPCKIDEVGAAIEVKPVVIDPETDVAKLKIADISKKLDDSELIEKMMRQTREMKKAVGAEKMVCGQLVGPFSAANMMVGVKEFMTLLGKRSPYVAPLLEYATEFCRQIAHRYRENGADLMQVADPCSSGDLISPRMYKELVVPTLEKLYGDMQKDYGLTMLHVCGKAGMREPEILKIGINAFSVDSPVNIPEAMKEGDGKLCMMGNFDPNGLLRLGTAKECYDAAMTILVEAPTRTGYIMMPGCDLAATTPADNLRALVRAATDFAARG